MFCTEYKNCFVKSSVFIKIMVFTLKIFFKKIMIIVGPGEVPTNAIDVYNKTRDSLTIEWNAPSEGHVTYYEVLFECISPNSDTSMKQPNKTTVGQPLAVARNLEPGTTCTVNITTFINETNSLNLKGKLTSKLLSNSTTEIGK